MTSEVELVDGQEAHDTYVSCRKGLNEIIDGPLRKLLAQSVMGYIATRPGLVIAYQALFSHIQWQSSPWRDDADKEIYALERLTDYFVMRGYGAHYDTERRTIAIIWHAKDFGKLISKVNSNH